MRIPGFAGLPASPIYQETVGPHMHMHTAAVLCPYTHIHMNRRMCVSCMHMCNCGYVEGEMHKWRKMIAEQT